MRYYVTIHGHVFEIDVESAGTVVVDGERIAVDMQRSGRLNLYSLLVNNRSYEVVIEPNAGPEPLYDVLVSGARYEAHVQDERSRRLAQATAALAAPAGELAIRPPIPGLVVEIPVTEGEPVVRGQPLVILEAMKMQNELRAPRNGIVQEIRVAAGAQVSPQDTLLILK